MQPTTIRIAVVGLYAHAEQIRSQIQTEVDAASNRQKSIQTVIGHEKSNGSLCTIECNFS